MSLANEAEAIEQLASRLVSLHPQRIVLEATGGLETLCASILMSHGLPVAIVNPRQTRSFARGLGKLAKTDRIDAETVGQVQRRSELCHSARKR